MRMKRILSLLLVLISLITLALPAAGLGKVYSFIDEGSECIIPVPEDWKVVYEDDCVEFLPKHNDDVVMRFYSDDLWEGLSASEQEEISRKDFASEISKSDVAELFDVNRRDVDKVVISGEEFYQIEEERKEGFLFFRSTVEILTLIHFRNGWMFTYQYEGDPDDEIYDIFEEMVVYTDYGDTYFIDVTIPETVEETEPEETEPSEASIYQEAVDAYESGMFTTADKLFRSISPYKDSEKFRRLIRIRDYGENTGIGVVYNYNKALTDAEKKDIDEAAADFYFADTAEVLLCNTDVATYYLYGDWATPSGVYPYTYFRLKKHSSWGYYYTRSENLSKKESDCVSIEDGDVRISITSSNTLVFHITLTAPDCMEIYSHEYCKSFTLYRN